jgi:hypothetical protein
MTTASNMLNEAVGELFRMCCFLAFYLLPYSWPLVSLRYLFDQRNRADRSLIGRAAKDEDPEAGSCNSTCVS